MNDQGEWDGWTGSCYYELYNEITLFNVAFFPSMSAGIRFEEW